MRLKYVAKKQESSRPAHIAISSLTGETDLYPEHLLGKSWARSPDSCAHIHLSY